MNPFVDRLLRAWTSVDELVRLEDRFAELYTDPVRVNGSNLALVDLVARALSLHAAFSELGADVVQVVEDGLAPVTTVRSPPFSGRSLIRAGARCISVSETVGLLCQHDIVEMVDPPSASAPQVAQEVRAEVGEPVNADAAAKAHRSPPGRSGTGSLDVRRTNIGVSLTRGHHERHYVGSR